MTRCRLACLSTRKLIFPPLIAVMALATSVVTVPVFGLGIKPRGPRILAIRPTLAIWSGVAIAASKSSQPPCHLDGGIHRGRRGLLGQRRRLQRAVEPAAVNILDDLAISLTALHHTL